jgi:alanine transaminase
VDGTYHFRTTFLPPETDMEEVSRRMTDFHGAFLKKYGAPEA